MEYYCQRTVDWLEAHKLKTLAEARVEIEAYRRIKEFLITKKLLTPSSKPQNVAIFVTHLVDINF